jgi:cell division protein FtsL
MPARVEKIARENLRMQLPPAGRVEIVDTTRAVR